MPNNDNLKRLHDNLTAKWDGFKVPYEQFEKDMQNEENVKKLHSNLASKWDGFEVPYEQFSSDMGLKKKDQTYSPDFSQGVFGGMDKLVSGGQSTGKETKLTPDEEQGIVPIEKIKSVEKKLGTSSDTDIDFGRYLGKRFESGSAQILANILRVPETIWDIAANAANKVMEFQTGLAYDIQGKEMPLIQTSKEIGEMTGIENKPAKILETRTKILNEIDQKYQKPILESVKKGDIKGAAISAAGSISESLPFMLSMILPGAAGVKTAEQVAATTAVMASGQKQSLIDRKDLSETQKNANAIIYGLAESLDAVLGAGVTGKVIKQIAEETGEQGVKKFGSDVVTDLIKKNPYLQPFAEALQEGTTQYIQNAADKYINKEDKSLMEGVADAMIIGGLMGVVGTGAIKTTQALKKNKPLDKTEITIVEQTAKDEKLKEATVNEINSQVQDGVITAEEGANLTAQLNNNIEAITKIPTDFDADKKATALELIKEKQSLEKEVSTLDPAFKGKNDERINQINTELQDLTKPVEQQISDQQAKLDELVKEKVVTEEESKVITPEEIKEKHDELRVKKLNDKLAYIRENGENVTELTEEAVNEKYNEIISKAPTAEGVKVEAETKPIEDEKGNIEAETKETLQVSEEKPMVASEEKTEVAVEADPLKQQDILIKEGKITEEEAFKLSKTKTQELYDQYLKEKEDKDAIQVEKPNEEVLRDERSEVGLQEVEQGNAKQEVVAEKDGKEEINPKRIEEMSADELAIEYENEKTNAETSELENWQDEVLWSKINPESFARYGDKNRVDAKLMEKHWLDPKGRDIDTFADELSTEQISGGKKITPQDIIDVIEKYQDKKVETKNQKISEIRSAYKDIMGKNAMVEKHIPYKPITIEPVKRYLEYKKQDITDIDAIEKFIEENKSDFQGNIFGFNHSDYLDIKRYIDSQREIETLDYKREPSPFDDLESTDNIGVSRAYTDVLLNTLGKDPLIKTLKKSNTELWESTIEKVKNNEINPSETVNDFQSNKKKKFTDEDVAVILIDRVNLLKERDNLVSLMGKAIETGNSDLIIECKKALAENDISLETNIEVSKNVGTAAGRALQAFKLLSNRSFELLEYEAKLLNGGKDLTKAQKDVFQKLKDENARLESEIIKAKEVAEQKIRKERRDAKSILYNEIRKEIEGKNKKEGKKYSDKTKEIADRIRKLKTKPLEIKDADGNVIVMSEQGISWNTLVEEIALVVEKGGKIADYVAEKYSNLTARDHEAITNQLEEYFELKEPIEKRKPTKDEATAKTLEEIFAGVLHEGMRPELIKLMKKEVETQVSEGVDNYELAFENVYEEVKQYIPEVDKSKLADIIANYGEFKKLPADKVKLQLSRNIKNINLDQKLQRARKGLAVARNGRERQVATQEMRAKEKEILKLVKEQDVKIELTDEQKAARYKSEVDIINTKLSNRIEDLKARKEKIDSAIAKNEKIIKETPVSKQKPFNDRTKELEFEKEGIEKDLKESEKQYEKVFGEPESSVGEKKIESLQKQLDKIVEGEGKKGKEAPVYTEVETKEISRLKDEIYKKSGKLKADIEKELKKIADKKEKEKLSKEQDIESMSRANELNKALEDINDAEKLREEIKSAVKKAESEKIKELEKREKEALKAVSDFEKKEAKSMEKEALDVFAEENKIKKRIDNIEKDIHKINEGIANLKQGKTELGEMFPEKKIPSKKTTSNRIKELEELRDNLAADKMALIPEDIKNSMVVEKYKKITQSKNDALKEQLATGNFEKKQKDTRVDDAELRQLLLEQKKLKEKAEEEIEKIRLKNQDAWAKIGMGMLDAINVTKALMGGGELSGALRQGVMGLTKPTIWARSFAAMHKFAFSEKAFNKWHDNLKMADDYYDMKYKHKLFIAEENGKLNAREEMFISRLVKLIRKIPVYGQIFKGSERGYVGFLNKLRVDWFRDYKSALEDSGLKGEALDVELKSYADMVNNFTGRSKLNPFGKKASLESAAPAINTILWAPRNMGARLNMINPAYYKSLTPRARVELAKTMLKFIGIGTTALLIANAAGAEVEWDPRSADFGKIKVGNLRFDPWGGMQQPVRVISQLIAGETKSTTTGKVKSLKDPKFGESSRADVLGRFLQSKMSPTASFLYGFTEGRTIVGEKFDVKEEALGRITFLLYKDIYDIMQKEGLASAVAAFIPGFYGIGVQSYSNKKGDKQKPRI